MKKSFVFALFCVIFFMIGCGGNDNNKVSGGSCSYDEAYYDVNKCINGGSYSCECEKYEDEYSFTSKCEKYFWVRAEICKSSCNSSTGKCDKAECSIEQADAEIYECKDNYSFKCQYGEKDSNGEYHPYWSNADFCLTGCNSATGRCQLCEKGSFACFDNIAFECLNNGSFSIYEICDENGCNSSTGKCKNSKYCEKEDEGKTFCSGDKLAVCENGRNTFTECKGGCDSSKNQCKPWKDSETGLMWSSKAPTAMFWQNAVDYCEDLSLGGYFDWRLPTISELETLILKDCRGSCDVADSCLSYSECYSSKCKNYICPSTITSDLEEYIGYFWSSSSISDKNGEKWSISFFGEDSGTFTKNVDSKLGVFCVR